MSEAAPSQGPNRLVVAACALAVGLIAVLLRLPSCYESLWIDELHTAWCVWGDFGDVSSRAAVGNQTPLYFQLMWFWKNFVGESEFALRLSSVLATSLAAALSVVALSTTARLSAGLIAGLMLAFESNAIFFGTELRPYAAIVFLSVIAVWLAALIWQATNEKQIAALRAALVTTVSVAALIQPTSLVTLGLLALVAIVVKFKPAWSRADMVSVFVLALTLLLLWNSSIAHSWERREQWRVFAKATSVQQAWAIWAWVPLVLVPLGIGCVTVWRRPARRGLGLIPLLVGTASTAIFFAASYYDWVFLWHRRYVIAVLPMFACFAGVWSTIGIPDRPTWLDKVLCSVVVVVIVGTLVWHQGTARLLYNGQTRLAFRGEGWRGAVAWVNKHRQPEESVVLDSDLIEATCLHKVSGSDLQASDVELFHYLQFPVAGPYQVEARPESLFRFGARPGTWLISRSNLRLLRSWVVGTEDPKIRQFGRIFVVHIK